MINNIPPKRPFSTAPFSIGCVVLCLLGFISLLAFNELRDFLSFLVIPVIMILFISFFYSLYELLYKQKEKPVQTQMPLAAQYSKKKNIITNSEKDFYDKLQQAVNLNKYSIMQQVPLTSVINKDTLNSYRNELFRTIDFCVINKSTYEPLVLIELNDASHNRLDRIERDKKIAAICQNANIPLLFFKTSDANTYQQIVGALKPYL